MSYGPHSHVVQKKMAKQDLSLNQKPAVSGFSSAEGEIRTRDQGLMSPLLYH